MSKTKLYELRRMQNAKLETQYKGVHITLNFRAGFGINGMKVGQLITGNEFVQDAIENDPRFGSLFTLKREYEDAEEEPIETYQLKQVEERPKAKPKTNAEIFAENKAKREAKAKKPSAQKPAVNDVDSVRNLNDAVAWFADNGELLKDAGQIDELCQKHGVRFPNLTL